MGTLTSQVQLRSDSEVVGGHLKRDASPCFDQQRPRTGGQCQRMDSDCCWGVARKPVLCRSSTEWCPPLQVDEQPLSGIDTEDKHVGCGVQVDGEHCHTAGRDGEVWS